jgi:UMF1 family MFS transporter
VNHGRRAVLGWALYDWANSAFATTVIAGLFPVFFRECWSAGASDAAVTFRLGAANTVASLAVAVLAPVIGAVADRGRAKKRFLLAFTAFGILATTGLAAAPAGQWFPALALFAVALIFWSAAISVYDSLLTDVADLRRLDRVSALGYSLGYLGGGLLFAVNVFMVQSPSSFGLPDAAAAVRVSFLTVAGWWALFTLPLAAWVRERAEGPMVRGFAAVREGLRDLRAMLREVRRYRHVALFLLAYWLYIDGVDTIIRMAVDHGRSLGLPAGSLIVALLVTQFVGFPAAIAFGWFGNRIGARRGIFLGLGVYCGVTLWAAFLTKVWEFYALAIAVGLVQGGVQALSRSFFARLVPPDRAATFFGFYNMVGKYAAILGPVLLGGVKLATGSARIGIASILVLFLAGGALLAIVRDPEPGPPVAE